MSVVGNISKPVAVGRVCIRAGCGRPLLRKDGTPDYRRHFCSTECLRQDKRERLQVLRARAKTLRCPHCGRKALQDASNESRVKLHHPLNGDSTSRDGSQGQASQLICANRL